MARKCDLCKDPDPVTCEVQCVFRLPGSRRNTQYRAEADVCRACIPDLLQAMSKALPEGVIFESKG